MLFLRRVSARIGRWPRLAAVGICLLLALGSALGSARRRGPAPPPTVAVVVAARDLPAGHVLAPADLTVARWPPSLRPAGTAADPRRLRGETLTGPLAAREPVTHGRLLGAGLTRGLARGTVAVAVTLGADPGGLVRPGGRIDLVAVPSALDLPGGRVADAGPPSVVARGALVLAVGPPAAATAEPAGPRLVVAVSRDTALRIAGATSTRSFTVITDPP